MGYLQLDGTTVQESKGYICPLGQICTVCVVFSLFLRTPVKAFFWTRNLEMGWMTDHNPFLEQESANPFSDIESFDAIYYAALQVVIVAGANGVSGHQLITYSSRQR
jgi:voltage-dependent calcium channel